MKYLDPGKLAIKSAVSVEKRIQFTGLCTIKVSEREISKQMKVSKTAKHNTIKNFKKSTFKDSKKTGRPRISSSGNKRFIRMRVSQSFKSSAEKNTG